MVNALRLYSPLDSFHATLPNADGLAQAHTREQRRSESVSQAHQIQFLMLIITQIFIYKTNSVIAVSARE